MSTQWYYVVSEIVHGPVDPVQLRRLLAQGEVSQSTMVKSTTNHEWVRAGSVEGLLINAPKKDDGKDRAAPHSTSGPSNSFPEGSIWLRQKQADQAAFDQLQKSRKQRETAGERFTLIVIAALICILLIGAVVVVRQLMEFRLSNAFEAVFGTIVFLAIPILIFQAYSPIFVLGPPPKTKLENDRKIDCPKCSYLEHVVTVFRQRQSNANASEMTEVTEAKCERCGHEWVKM